MWSRGRKLLLGMLMLVALTYAVGVPRLWHAHTAADAEHTHSSADVPIVHPGHSHSRSHNHSHSHSHSHHHHSHGHHSHGHAHSHSHGPSHSHSHSPTVHSEDNADEQTSSVQRPNQWHLHVSLLGWEFTIWGSDIAPGSTHQGLAQTEHSHGTRDAVDDGKTAVSAVDFDWLAHWDAAWILMPLRRSTIELPFDASRHFAALDDESPDSADLQPPVPPPRVIL